VDSIRNSKPGARRVMQVVLPVVLCALITWPVIFSGFVRGRGAGDQLNYHEQAIRRFAAELPHPDFSDYLSATTPGYHTVLAVIARTVSDERSLLQWAGSLFTLGLVGLLAWAVRRQGSPSPEAGPAPSPPAASGAPIMLVLPLMLSMAVFHSGVWMLPDNAGWLGVLGVWLLALRGKFDWVTVVGGGLALTALVLVRQIHLWPWAMLLTAAWLGPRGPGDAGFDFGRDMRELCSGPGRRLVRTGLVFAAGVPAVLALLWFWRLWGDSLTPPVFHERHVGVNPTAPAFVLALFGSIGLFFLAFVVDGLRALWVRHTWLLVLAVVVSLALGLAGPSTRTIYEGRNSGLWELVRYFPAPGRRSVVLVPLAVLGGVQLAAWFVQLDRRDRWIMLAAAVAFMAAQCASFQLWQRYTEPLVLLWLALAASRVRPARSPAGEGWRLVGPGVLAGAMAVLTAASLIFGRPVAPRALLFPGETAAPVLPGMVGGDREGRYRNDGPAERGRSGVEDLEGRSPPGH
jgi:hypothetical protein